MEKYTLAEDIKAFGAQVKTFPYGIGEAFEKLVKMLPADNRPFYGISECTSDGIIYNAAALETYDGEAEKYNCDKYIIESGDYLTIRVTDWLKKTDFIKVVFEELFKDERSDRSKPCIEIYENDDEMVCMVKINELKNILSEIENVSKDLVEVISSFSQDKLNTVPFEGSWTAAQVTDHIMKSTTAMERFLKRPGIATKRKPNERVGELKKIFLDFNTRLQSPDFILPSTDNFKIEVITENIKSCFEQLKQTGEKVNLSDMLKHLIFGEITRLEILYFILYHTQRHIHQIKNIAQKLI